MKKIIFICLSIMLLGCKVNAETLIRSSGHVITFANKNETSKYKVPSNFNSLSNYKEVAQYFEQETKKYLSNVAPVKWPDETIETNINNADLNYNLYKKEYEEDGLGNDQGEVRKNVIELFKQSSDNSSMLYSYVPAELSASGIARYGGSNGWQANPDMEDHFLKYKQNWYPIILEDLISIHKNDANGQKINFNYSKSKYENTVITDNGNVDANGIYTSLNKLKLTKKEYNDIIQGKEKLKLYISQYHSPFAMDYIELYKNDGTTEALHIDKHGYTKNGIEVDLKASNVAYYKHFETLYLDSSYIKDNAINGIYLMQTGSVMKYNGSNELSSGINNLALDETIKENGAIGIVYYYRFKIELEIEDDNSSSNVFDKNIIDNNAKIFIDNEAYNIDNKKSVNEGRIYVDLETICDYINCSYSYNVKEKNYVLKYYPIKNNKQIVYSMTFSENDTIFKSVLKVYDEVYSFKNKILDASPFREDETIYVPIRFLLEGLGARVDYYPSNGYQPEEVYIFFDVDRFIETSIDGEIYENEDINLFNQNKLKIKQNYILYDNTKKVMSNGTLIITNDNYNICYNNEKNCDLNIRENTLEVNTTKCIKNLETFMINKYNDYPYIKQINININCK